jgi:hypothetical protein
MSHRRALQEKKMLDFLNKFPDIAVLKDKNIDKKVGNIKESLSAPKNPTAVVPNIGPQFPKYKPNPMPASQALLREHNLPKFGSIANISTKGNLVSNILSGGLGNCIFKILAGLGYSEKYGKQYVICKGYIHDGSKPHEKNLLPYINRIFPNLSYVESMPNAAIIEEAKQMNYSALPLRLENVLLKGYFQDIDYFPSKERIPVIKTRYYQNTYFIHIRAGDYLLFPGEWEFNIKKYHEACFSILGNVKYIVFSNDNDYAQNYIKQFNIDYTMSNKVDPVDTLIEMANCAGGICTNSSFSWLGAFFQGDKRGQIFMPSVWNKIKDCRGIYPRWATIINVDTGNETTISKPIINHKEFVSVILSGGLGNRIFQIFAGMAYAEKYGKQFVLCKSLYQAPKIDHEAITDKYIEILFPKIEYVDHFSCYTRIHELNHMDYNELAYSKGNVLLNGYFQVEQYSLRLNKDNIPNIRTNYYENTYFIHIRLGDYIGFHGMDFDLTNYHKRCFDILGPDAKYIVFSNENDKADIYMKKFNVSYIISDKTDPLETLIEMANCAGAISANSTFSWFGAFFQRSPRSNVYFPAKWIPNGKPQGIYPSWAARIEV